MLDRGPVGVRWRNLRIAIFAALFVIVWTPAVQAWQEEAAAEESAAVEEGDGSEPASPLSTKTGLAWLIEAMGIQFFVIQLAVGIAVMALILTNIVGVLRGRFINDAFVGQFEGMVKNRQFKEAFDLSKQENNFLGKVMVAGMSRLSDGYPDAMTAMQEAGSAENLKNEHRLSILGMLANIATLLGLLGTVWGMVVAFGKLSKPGYQPEPSELAQGVNQALITTVVGLLEAIPAIFFFTILANLNTRRLTDVAIIAENLMRPFKQVSVGRKPTSASAPPATAQGQAPAVSASPTPSA